MKVELGDGRKSTNTFSKFSQIHSNFQSLLQPPVARCTIAARFPPSQMRAVAPPNIQLWVAMGREPEGTWLRPGAKRGLGLVESALVEA